MDASRPPLGTRMLSARRGQPPGFRIDAVDVAFLAFLLALSAGLEIATGLTALAMVPAYLGLTFFLFCNVFRIGNRLEPLWYLPFTAVAAWCLYAAEFERFWILVAFVLEPWKWALVAYRILKGPYVGVLSRAGRAPR